MITFDTPLYLLFVALPLMLPLAAGLVILVGYGNDELNRLVGFITIKPVIAYPIWFYLAMTVSTTWYDNWFDTINQSLGHLLPILPAIFLTIGIVYTFRSTFADLLAWLFLGLDLLRMFNTLILSNSDDLDGYTLPFGLVLPSVIAILALVIVVTRRKRMLSA